MYVSNIQKSNVHCFFSKSVTSFTENAWVLTRARIAPTNVMQAAYGVLDKYKISRAFFVKTNQADCNILPSPVESPESKSAVVVDDVVAKNAAVLPDVVVPEKVAEVCIDFGK